MANTSGFVSRVVKTCLRIGNGDRVTVYTWRHTLDLAEAFAMECRKAGAKTLIELTTDDVYYLTVLDLPVEYLKQPDPFSVALLEVNTAEIFIAGPENPHRLKEITPERMGAMVEADKAYYDRFLERKIRSAEVAYGYVTPQRAETYGFSYDDWMENMHAALDVDYDRMRDTGRKIGEMLEQATEAHVVSSDGTDLRFALEHRVAHVSDGVIDEDDLQRGDVFTSLPSGSVGVVPKERSATGKVVSDAPEANAGLLIQGVTWEFRDGKLVSFEGKKNVEATKAMLEKGRGDKDQMSALFVGLNPKARIGFLYNPIVLGAITIGIGDNRQLGGTLESDFGFHCTISKPTLELDGKVVIKNGTLIL